MNIMSNQQDGGNGTAGGRRGADRRHRGRRGLHLGKITDEQIIAVCNRLGVRWRRLPNGFEFDCSSNGADVGEQLERELMVLGR